MNTKGKMKSKSTAPPQHTLLDVANQLAALEAGLGLSGAIFSRDERKQVRGSSKHVPSTLIELVANCAAGNGGVIAGMPFDVVAAREALTQVSTAQAAVRAARQFAQRVADDATLRRSVVADRAFGIYVALQRFVRTPEGKPLKDVYDQMTSVMRANKKARTTSASKKTPAKADVTAKAAVVAGEPATPAPAPTAVAGDKPASTTSAQ
jgi:hypothetical protein